MKNKFTKGFWRVKKRCSGWWDIYTDLQIEDGAIAVLNHSTDRCEEYREETTKVNAKLICDAVNGTAGIGINPNSVKEMKEALEEITKEFEYALENHVAVLRGVGIPANLLENSTLKKAKQALKNSEL